MKDEPKTMTCSCCGGRCRGRQWHNRDTGYSLCCDCLERINKKATEKPHLEIEMRDFYGDKGYHCAIPDSVS